MWWFLDVVLYRVSQRKYMTNPIWKIRNIPELGVGCTQLIGGFIEVGCCYGLGRDLSLFCRGIYGKEE